MKKNAYRVNGTRWVGIVTEEMLGEQKIYSLEWMPKEDMSFCSGPSLEGVLDCADACIHEMDNVKFVQELDSGDGYIANNGWLDSENHTLTKPTYDEKYGQ